MNLNEALPGLGDAADEASSDVPTTSPPILFCPVCTTNADASTWGLTEVECSNCGTTFAVVVREKIVAEHSMY